MLFVRVLVIVSIIAICAFAIRNVFVGARECSKSGGLYVRSFTLSGYSCIHPNTENTKGN